MSILTDPCEIDLTKHGVIEAHAGTGKTYTIVKLVMRVLLGEIESFPILDIRNLLLVTYTEKAAGELQDRIRKAILEEIKCQNKRVSPDLNRLERLNQNLSYLGEAMIGTIHSVCQRILKTWPFESGSHFKSEMVSDKEGLSTIYYRLIREEWGNTASKFNKAFEILAFENESLHENSQQIILELSEHLLDDQNTMLDIENGAGMSLTELIEIFGSEGNTQQYVSTVMQEILVIATQVRDILNEIKVYPEFSRSKKSIEVKINKLEILLQGDFDNNKDVLEIEWVTESMREKSVANSQIRNSIVALGVLKIKAQQTLEKLEWKTQLVTAILNESALRLAQMWQNEKNQTGLNSFNDLLRSTHRAVLAQPALVAHIRDKIAFAIIDEFQDTSLLQWEIFEKIFIKSEGGLNTRLIIVGDSKQSIYAFQGADVQSYIQAKKCILENNGKIYSLVDNYRSVPTVIEGYNAIFAQMNAADNWFINHDVRYPSIQEGGEIAKTPECHLDVPATNIPHGMFFVEAQGNAKQVRLAYAHVMGRVIQAIHGNEVPLPEGKEWKLCKLKLTDIAVLSRSNQECELLVQELRSQGIPAVKYKAMGVFESDMAVHVRIILQAIDRLEPKVVLASLLTPFFNVPIDQINPDQQLNPSSKEMQVLQKLADIAQKKQWGLLVGTLLKETQVEQTLMHLLDGEQLNSDLHQILDYCLELLIIKKQSLQSVTDFLISAANKTISVPDDASLFQKASSQDAVQVMTMHASKGLEFAVVFVDRPKTISPHSRKQNYKFIANSKKHVYASLGVGKGADNPLCAMQEEEESRRLLYVAMTRAKFLNFALLIKNNKGEISNNEFMSNRIQQCMAESKGSFIRKFHESLFPNNSDFEKIRIEDISSKNASTNIQTPHILIQNESIKKLDLYNCFARQTSYTQLAHGMDLHRQINKADEPLDDTPSDVHLFENPVGSVLPKGKVVGDCVHNVMEILIDEGVWTIDEIVLRLSKEFFDKHVEVSEEAIHSAAIMVQRGLCSTMDLRGISKVSLHEIIMNNSADCKAELEFQLSHDSHWIHGFMDVVFRVGNPQHPQHPWRYFVLDWKTNCLPKYTEQSIVQSIFHDKYDIQAKIYLLALHKHLQKVLGSCYDTSQNLGSAVYVYLRGYEHAENIWTWQYTAEPAELEVQVQELMSQWNIFSHD